MVKTMKWLIFCSFIFLSSLKADITILYVRHGQVPGNNPHPDAYIYTGCNTNESLTEKGKTQALLCALQLEKLQKTGKIDPITAIYSSDLKRAQETASPIAERLKLNIELRENLREIDWGSADGRLVSEMNVQWKSREKQIIEQYPDKKERWDHLPVFEGAETYNALLKRTLIEFDRLEALHKDQTILIVGHGRVLKTLIAEASKSDTKIPYPSNCEIAEFRYSTNKKIDFIQVYQLE